MAFSEIELYKIKKIVGSLCEKRSPAHIIDQLRVDYKIQNQDIIIFEIRPQWNDPKKQIVSPFAKLKFVRSRNHWKLYWHRADMKWHKYMPFESSRDLAELLKEIDTDQNGCFFG